MKGGTIGIIGGGQLGRMLTMAAIPLGFKVVVLDPGENSPAAQAGAKQIVKDYDGDGIAELANQVDYLTTEFEEGLDPLVLEELVNSGAKINPAPQTIALILDKLKQKDYLSQKRVAMGRYAPIKTAQDAYKLLQKYGGKMLIKTCRGGYDGYGNRMVSSKKEVDQALKDFSGRKVYAEAFVLFKKELAVMVVRDSFGKIVTYPVVETIQKNNICHLVLAPAQVSTKIQKAAEDMAKQVVSHFEGSGAFGVEMFLTGGGKVLFNEVAPRVHNSGHYTIDACAPSQFEQHIRAVAGLPLNQPTMLAPAAVMINILGERTGPVELQGLHKALSLPQVNVHIYGKTPTKTGRKMGHITALGQTPEEALQKAQQARKALSI